MNHLRIYLSFKNIFLLQSHIESAVQPNLYNSNNLAFLLIESMYFRVAICKFCKSLNVYIDNLFRIYN